MRGADLLRDPGLPGQAGASGWKMKMLLHWGEVAHLFPKCGFTAQKRRMLLENWAGKV